MKYILRLLSVFWLCAFGMTMQGQNAIPASDFIRLKIENYEAECLSYQLYNANGTPVQNDVIQGRETIISMQNFLPATYFLKVTNNNIVVKTSKIIKR